MLGLRKAAGCGQAGSRMKPFWPLPSLERLSSRGKMGLFPEKTVPLGFPETGALVALDPVASLRGTFRFSLFCWKCPSELLSYSGSCFLGKCRGQAPRDGLITEMVRVTGVQGRLHTLQTENCGCAGWAGPRLPHWPLLGVGLGGNASVTFATVCPRGLWPPS